MHELLVIARREATTAVIKHVLVRYHGKEWMYHLTLSMSGDIQATACLKELNVQSNKRQACKWA